MKIDTMRIQKVHFMPNDFEPGVLYVSKEYGVAGHLCACGCGNKVMTPLGKSEWTIKNSKKGVSVWPSVGNGQLRCKTHYIITDGCVLWCAPMESDFTAENLRRDADLRREYYDRINSKLFNRLKILVTSVVHKIIRKKEK